MGRLIKESTFALFLMYNLDDVNRLLSLSSVVELITSTIAVTVNNNHRYLFIIYTKLIVLNDCK